MWNEADIKKENHECVTTINNYNYDTEADSETIQILINQFVILIYISRDAITILFIGCITLIYDMRGLILPYEHRQWYSFVKASMKQLMMSECSPQVAEGGLIVRGLANVVWGLHSCNRCHLRAALMWRMYGLPCCQYHLWAWCLRALPRATLHWEWYCCDQCECYPATYAILGLPRIWHLTSEV